jgi:hypothetical protein
MAHTTSQTSNLGPRQERQFSRVERTDTAARLANRVAGSNPPIITHTKGAGNVEEPLHKKRKPINGITPQTTTTATAVTSQKIEVFTTRLPVHFPDKSSHTVETSRFWAIRITVKLTCRGGR